MFLSTFIFFVIGGSFVIPTIPKVNILLSEDPMVQIVHLFIYFD